MRAFILFLAAIVLVACTALQTRSGASSRQTAPAVTALGRDCFDLSFATDYDSEAGNIVRLHVGASAEYDVRVSGGGCNTLDQAQHLALESTSSSWICVGDQVGQGNIRFRDLTSGRRVSCYIESVRRVPQ
jgi:hypothetical protein